MTNDEGRFILPTTIGVRDHAGQKVEAEELIDVLFVNPGESIDAAMGESEAAKKPANAEELAIAEVSKENEKKPLATKAEVKKG